MPYGQSHYSCIHATPLVTTTSSLSSLTIGGSSCKSSSVDQPRRCKFIAGQVPTTPSSQTPHCSPSSFPIPSVNTVTRPIPTSAICLRRSSQSASSRYQVLRGRPSSGPGRHGRTLCEFVQAGILLPRLSTHPLLYRHRANIYKHPLLNCF